MLNHRRITIGFIATSLLYLISLNWRPYPLDFVVKALPILLLMFWMMRTLPTKVGKLASLALLFSAMGDIALALTFHNHFLLGLGLFLIAQLFYLRIFFSYRNQVHKAVKVALAAAIVLFGVAMSITIAPQQALLFVALNLYLVIICCMALAAIASWSKAYWQVIGALVFISSDSLIAWNMFQGAVPGADLLIMLTYYGAQLMIVMGITQLSDSQHVSTSN